MFGRSRDELNLPRVRFSENFAPTDFHGKQFLLLRVAEQLDSVAESFVKQIATDSDTNLTVGRAAGSGSVPGSFRVLRVVRTDRSVHHGKVDLTLTRPGDDLFVRFEAAGKTALRFLKAGLYAIVFVSLWSILFILLYTTSDLKGAMRWEIAQKRNYDPVLADLAAQGWVIGEDGTPQLGSPMSLLALYRNDPSLFLWKLGIPGGVIAGICAALLRFAPPELVRWPCRVLRWPIPAEYESFVIGHASWAEGVLSSVLFNEFGLDETQTLSVGPC